MIVGNGSARAEIRKASVIEKINRLSSKERSSEEKVMSRNRKDPESCAMWNVKYIRSLYRKCSRLVYAPGRK